MARKKTTTDKDHNIEISVKFVMKKIKDGRSVFICVMVVGASGLI